jgi:peptidoglycan/xylan/chitin deacetylase (PgdA/CDA1 family)
MIAESFMKILRKALRKLVLKTGYLVGLFALFDSLNAKSCRILTYHGISKEESLRLSGMDVTEEVFAAQIEMLSSRYKIVPLSETGKHRKGISITFDDGSLSQFTYAAPVLNAHGVKATFFVCSDLAEEKRPATWNDLTLLSELREAIQKGPHLPNQDGVRAIGESKAIRFEEGVREERSIDPYLLLERHYGSQCILDALSLRESWDRGRFVAMKSSELRELVSKGHEIGSHSASHRILSHLVSSPETLMEELRGSKEALEKSAGKFIDYIAYPFGGKKDAGIDIEEATKKAGYRSGFYNYWTGSPDSYRRGRISLPCSKDPAEVFAITSGFVHFIKTGHLL